MKDSNKHNSKLIKFLNGKTFYVVLCLCFLAIGIAAWTGVEGFKNIQNAESSQQSGTDTPSEPTVPSEPIDIGFNDKDDNSNEQVELPEKTESKDTESLEPEESEQVAAPVASFFINPVLGEVIKGYSDTELQYSLTMKDMRMHKAVDIAADVGTPVVAAGEGTVTDIIKDAMYGTTVVIDHGNGIVVKYCGLSNALFVSKGDTVDSTKQIGVVDIIPCESVEQRHLHLEFFKNGKAVSPLDYIIK